MIFELILIIIRLLEVIFLFDIRNRILFILLISFLVLLVFFIFIYLVLNCHWKLRRLILDELFLLDLLHSLDGVQLYKIIYLLQIKDFKFLKVIF